MDIKVISLSPPDSQHDFPLKLFHSHPSPQPRLFREHRHLDIEIGYFKSGSGTYKTSTTDYTIKAGDIFIFRSNEFHWISKINPDEPMEIMNIHFEPRLIWSSYAMFYLPESLKLFTDRNISDFCNRLDRENPYHKEAEAILLNIETELQNKYQEYSLMVKNSILAFFVLLVRHFDYKNKDKSSFIPYQDSKESIEASMDYIQTHLGDDLNLSDITAIANLSKHYYSTVFKKLTGISPWEYILSKRIELAISYLCSSRLTILDIALKCGFKNTANFNKTFKKITGKTPREYKNNKRAVID